MELDRDALVEAVRPLAHRLSRAVENERPTEIANLLHPLDRQHLYALAVVLAAHVDQPIREAHRSRSDVDEVVVLRVLSGDAQMARAATRAERAEIVRQWRDQGRSMAELERITGWQPHRYTGGGTAA